MDEERIRDLSRDISEARDDADIRAHLMRPRWQWPEALAWVSLRDLEPICELVFIRLRNQRNPGQELRLQGHTQMGRLQALLGLRGPSKGLPTTIAEAQDLLVAAFEKGGDLVSTGCRATDLERENIPMEVWETSQIIRSRDSFSLASALHAENFPRIRYSGILINRAQLQAAFPPNGSNIRPSVSEPQAAMPPVRKINEKVDTVAWYKTRVAGWEGTPPSREEDQAAGAKFGLSSRRVNALRREHAPEEWQTKGRRISLKQ